MLFCLRRCGEPVVPPAANPVVEWVDAHESTVSGARGWAFDLTDLSKNFKNALCAQCRQAVANSQVCGQCRKMVYCSRACQKTHWRAGHQQQCIGSVQTTE